MTRIVIMAFAYDTVSVDGAPSYRVVAGDSVATTSGAHQATLVANLTRILAEHGVALDAVEQADGQRCVAVIMRAHIVNDRLTLGGLREVMNREGTRLGISVRVQREDLFMSMHRI